MLCPVCGRSDALCDCLVAGAPGQASGQANDGADVAGPGSGLGSMSAPSQDWADTLLQFVRDFAAASPHVAPPATPAQSGRDGPVGRGSVGGDGGHQAAAAAVGPVPSPVGQPADNAVAPGSVPAGAANAQPTSASAGAPSAGPAAARLRIAPFVTSATEEGAPGPSSASSGPAGRPGTTNSAWSGGEFELRPPEVPGRSR
jgi:hypothetical protein